MGQNFNTDLSVSSGDTSQEIQHHQADLSLVTILTREVGSMSDNKRLTDFVVFTSPDNKEKDYFLKLLIFMYCGSITDK